MSVDYITCVCGDNVSECAPSHMCSFCEQTVFDCCYDEQVKKYGVVGPEDKDELGIILVNQYGTGALKRCDECADVVDEPDRKTILLKACRDLLIKCRDSDYLISPMETTVFYDEADCDGFCLLDDIETELGE